MLVNFSVLIYVKVRDPSALSIKYISSFIEPSRSDGTLRQDDDKNNDHGEVEADDDLQEFPSNSKY